MNIGKNYLTSKEINGIIEAMKEKDNAFEREIVKIALVAQCCVDYDFKDYPLGNDIYDLIVENDLYNEIEMIQNYHIIDKIYKEESGVNAMLNSFVKAVGDIDDAKAKEFMQNSMMKIMEQNGNK